MNVAVLKIKFHDNELEIRLKWWKIFQTGLYFGEDFSEIIFSKTVIDSGKIKKYSKKIQLNFCLRSQFLLKTD